MAPNVDPLGVQVAAERGAKGVRSGLKVFLVKHGFAHAEMSERIAGLKIQSVLIFLDSLVVLAVFGKAFASCDERADSQAGAGFQHVVIGIDHDSVRLGPAERVDLECLRCSGHQDLLVFGVSFRVHADFNRHAKCIEILVNLAHDFETLSRAIDDKFKLEFRNAR